MISDLRGSHMTRRLSVRGGASPIQISHRLSQMASPFRTVSSIKSNPLSRHDKQENIMGQYDTSFNTLLASYTHAFVRPGSLCVVRRETALGQWASYIRARGTVYCSCLVEKSVDPRHLM